MARAAPALRNAYRVFVPVPVRWADIDAYGHMNNAAYLSVIDTAVSLWQLGQGWRLTGPEALRFLVVETGCRYHAEIGFPGTLDCGIRVAHLGRSSVTFEVGLFPAETDTAHAEGRFVMVLTDTDGAPRPIPQSPRAQLAAIAFDPTPPPR
jgi:acyl-CoA thioester hydrolase